MFFNGEQHNDNGGNVPVEGKFDVGTPFNAREIRLYISILGATQTSGGIVQSERARRRERSRAFCMVKVQNPSACHSSKISMTFYVKSDPLPLARMRRLQKELMSFIREPPPGVRVDADLADQNLTQWIVHMEGAKGTLYEGERFQLQFKFSSKYPFDSPEVTFIGALSVQSVCLSIVSMLSSCKEKKRPPDNSFYVKTCNKNPKKTKWWYHDDSV